jgi:Arc/MetJ-type ribon-helix-helix transcriptional regulator
MNIKVEGDKTRAACELCQKFASATWRYGPLVLKAGQTVDGVMQAYCDTCGSSLLIAHQSSYKLREAGEKSVKRTSVNLTGPLKDLVASCAMEFGAEPERGPELLLRVFLRALLDEPESLPQVASQLKDVEPRLLRGNKNQKVDVSFTAEMFEAIDALARASKTNRSEVIRRALVLFQTTPKLTDDLKRVIKTRGARIYSEVR